MIIVGTELDIVDNTGIVKCECISVLGSGKNIKGKIGMYILVVIKNYHIGLGLLKDERKWKKFSRGTIHKALIVRTKKEYKRSLGMSIRFSDNAAILVNKKNLPLGTRINGPILTELGLKKKNISLLSMAEEVI